MSIHHDSGTVQIPTHENEPKGYYAGIYQRKGTALVRTSDGLRLVMGYRGPQDNPKSAEHFLIDSTPGKGYLSNLYYGKAFDDKTYRYEIRWSDSQPDTCEIVTLNVLRRLQSRGVSDG